MNFALLLLSTFITLGSHSAFARIQEHESGEEALLKAKRNLQSAVQDAEAYLRMDNFCVGQDFKITPLLIAGNIIAAGRLLSKYPHENFHLVVQTAAHPAIQAVLGASFTLKVISSVELLQLFMSDDKSNVRLEKQFAIYKKYMIGSGFGEEGSSMDGTVRSIKMVDENTARVQVIEYGQPRTSYLKEYIVPVEFKAVLAKEGYWQAYVLAVKLEKGTRWFQLRDYRWDGYPRTTEFALVERSEAEIAKITEIPRDSDEKKKAFPNMLGSFPREICGVPYPGGAYPWH